MVSLLAKEKKSSMTRFGKNVGAAAASSLIIARVCTVFKTSIVFNIAGKVLRSLAIVERSLQGRLGYERRAEDDQSLVSITDRSILIQNIERLVVFPVVAFRASRLGRLRAFFAQFGFPERVQLIGVWLSAALVAQTVTVSLAGVPISLLGWGVRSVLAVIFLVFFFRSHAVGAAWSSRR